MVKLKPTFGIAQINPTVGDINANTQLMLSMLQEADEKNIDLVVFPEMALTGYPPEDLLLKPSFIKDNIAALRQLAKRIKKTAAVVGFVDEKNGQRFNAAAWLENGKIKAIYHKHQLPNYGVFDEQRYFSPGTSAVVVPFRGERIGLTICEDIWMKPESLHSLKKQKPTFTLNISASPFHAGKMPLRHKAARTTAWYLKTPVLYCNMVGGQDELVFDGGSFVMMPNGKITTQCPQFEAGLFTTGAGTPNAAALSKIEEIHGALILGIRDYVQKNRFQKVALGLSGGIDSALVATLAVDALGPERVVSVTMPSQFSSQATHSDAHVLATNLGIELLDISIQPLYKIFLETLAPAFAGAPPNIAEENLQARIRGTLLMALSNKFGWLILTTGNKSEISTGYCTLYGDTAGGFSVLKDVLKTTVYDLSRHINAKAGRERIPTTTIERRPTAELKENQFDEDSLGAYAALDPVIVGYVEQNKPVAALVSSLKQNRAYIKKITSLIDHNEYKRRQAPPGIKITPRSFGRDHRMPITNRYNPD